MDSVRQSKQHNISLNPKFVPFLNDVSAEELKYLYDNISVSVCGKGKIKVNPSALETV